MSEMTNSSFPFPHPVLTPISDRPTTDDVNLLKRQVLANLLAVTCDIGGGAHGHAWLGMDDASYLALAGVPPVVPVHPGDLPVWPIGTTQPLITAGNRLYDYSIQRSRTYQSVKSAVRSQILAAINPTYYNTLEDTVFGYANVEVIDLLNHLTNAYADVNASDLEKNRAQLANPWNPDEPMEKLWKRTLTIRQVATTAGDPISDTATMALTLQALKKAGVYSHAITTWKDKPAIDQTWGNFQTHFSRQDKIRRDDLTAEAAGYHGANKASELPSPASNDNPVAALQLQIADLQAAFRAGVQPPAKPEPMTDEKAPCSSADTELWWCWSHGLSNKAGHDSARCHNIKEGHQRKATLMNRMGGSNKFAFGRQGKQS
jgi:hypothetical protein